MYRFPGRFSPPDFLFPQLRAGWIGIVRQLGPQRAEEDFRPDFHRHPAFVIGQPENSVAVFVVEALEGHFRLHLDSPHFAEDAVLDFITQDADWHEMAFFIGKDRHLLRQTGQQAQGAGDEEGGELVVRRAVQPPCFRRAVLLLVNDLEMPLVEERQPPHGTAPLDLPHLVTVWQQRPAQIGGEGVIHRVDELEQAGIRHPRGEELTAGICRSEAQTEVADFHPAGPRYGKMHGLLAGAEHLLVKDERRFGGAGGEGQQEQQEKDKRHGDGLEKKMRLQHIRSAPRRPVFFSLSCEENFLTELANRVKPDGKKGRATVQLISIFGRRIMKRKRKKLPFTLMLAALACMTSTGAFADERTFTLDADFDQGTLINLNHNPNHDQLQLYDGDTKPFRFINVAASGRGTVVRIDTDTGEVVGEYKTAPEGRGLSPSRTSVDLRGNVWTANRGEAGDDKGSAVKIGIVVGGTRCNKDGSLNPNGDYVKLEPNKLTYNTCVDRDSDGLIRTSKGLLDALPWPDNGDGAGGEDARVQDAEDECILVYQRLPDAPNARHVSVDKGQADGDGDVWVAGHPYEPKMFYKLDGKTGGIKDSFDSRAFGCGGYGGLISNNVLWSSSPIQRALLRYDLSAKTGQCIPLHGQKNTDTSYGLGVDNNDFIWNNLWADHTITKINPDSGSEMPGFPVPTGGEYGRGVAITPKDNNVWSANSYEEDKTQPGTVSRLDANGNLLAVIPVGNNPTGVAVDYAGKVWVTNRFSHNAMRINPATNQVDLTVDLGANAEPYNYSDMTGIILLGHPPIGFWDVVYDGGCNTLWDKISWNSDENPATNSAVKVEIRAALTKAGLAAAPFQTVANGADLTGMKGQFIEVRATLTTEAPIGQRSLPVLKDLTLEHHPLTMTVNIPDQKYSFGFAPFDLDDFIYFNPAGNWFNDVIWSHSPLPAGWSVSIDENHVAAVTGPPNETNDVPITFNAHLAWGGEQCGIGEEVVFIANHPPVLCKGVIPKCLRQNNKKMVDMPLTDFVCDPDGDAVTVRITSITSDEPVGKDPYDASGIDTDTAWLRQERDAHSDGRVYVITFVASDGRGGETTMTLPVSIPHDQRGGGCNAVDSGQNYDATKPSEEGGKGGKGKKK